MEFDFPGEEKKNLTEAKTVKKSGSGSSSSSSSAEEREFRTSLKVDAHTGAAAEAVLTFRITLAVPIIVVKGPRNNFLKNLLITLATVVMVVYGSSFTDPSMNPAFGWAYMLDNGHNTWDHFYVFWICPFLGAIFAGWFFRALFPNKVKPSKKKKKA